MLCRRLLLSPLTHHYHAGVTSFFTRCCSSSSTVQQLQSLSRSTLLQPQISAASSSAHHSHRCFSSSRLPLSSSSSSSSPTPTPTPGRWDHHRHLASDSIGHTSRNPYYDLYLQLPSQLISTRWRDWRSIPHVWLLIGIIGVNVGIYLTWTKAYQDQEAAEKKHGPRALSSELIWMQQNFSSSLTNLREGRWWTLLTSGFSHQSFIHLAFNMAAMYQIAPAILLHMGPLHFVALYTLGAISCSVASISFYNFLAPRLGGKPRERVSFARESMGQTQLSYDLGAVGASGALFSMFAVSSFMYPRTKFSIFFLPPAELRRLFPLTMGASIAWTIFSPTQGVISHWGHVGGGLLGVVYYLLFLRNRRVPASFTHPAPSSAQYYRYHHQLALMREKQAQDELSGIQAMIQRERGGSEGRTPPTQPSSSPAPPSSTNKRMPRNTKITRTPPRQYSTLVAPANKR